MSAGFFRTAWLLCLSSVSFGDAGHHERVMAPLEVRQQAPLSFGSSWQVLGPFQIGTREATWGADPLEYVGGFRNLTYDPQAHFRSSLPTNGIATWNITKATQASNTPTSANTSLSISYSNVDWDFLKVVYGWSAVQYQAWARGEILVGGNHTQPVILHTDAVLEYWVDGTHYFGGDFFTYRKAPPVLHLSPGTHRVDLRLVRDVRAFGGILAPTIDVIVDMQQANGTLELAKAGILLSDVVSGKIASPLGSVFLRNSGEDVIELVGIQSPDVRSPVFIQESGSDSQLLLGRDLRVLTTAQTETATPYESNSTSVTFAPGQTRPVAINVSLIPLNASMVNLIISYRKLGSNKLLSLNVGQKLRHLSKYEPHKITFLHPGGMVSYAMLRPPARNASCNPSQRSNVPVLLALHGAGVEADSEMVTTQFDAVADLCAWVMYPTGVTSWSGDDWHNWGFSDVEAAVKAIPDWIRNVSWDGPGVDINRWIVTGHSNGGQGTWYAATHRVDKVLAAAPLSGYASIQKYVPYELWQPADPRRTAIVSASLNSYRHEMLMANTGGIPLQQQHGQIDDNVPAYNSRLLAQQLVLAGSNSSYNEVAGQNHYWDGVMTTPELVSFYYEQSKSDAFLPRRLNEFSFVVGDPGDTGSKGGIKVTNLQDPGQYGRINVKGHLIRTSNILSLEFNPQIWQDETISIDGQDISSSEIASDKSTWVRFARANGSWSAQTISKEDKPWRSGRQLGAMTAILRTHGHFIIQHDESKSASHVALQVSRNLHQYFQADADIVPSSKTPVPSNGTGNVITIVSGESPSNASGLTSDFPIQVSAGRVSVRDHDGVTQEYGDEAQGAAFLRPLEDERLELFIWGRDEEGLRQAARIVPMITGVGQPDFVVFGKSAQWKGVDGVLAMGFFDHRWEVTASSVVS